MKEINGCAEDELTGGEESTKQSANNTIRVISNARIRCVVIGWREAALAGLCVPHGQRVSEVIQMTSYMGPWFRLGLFLGVNHRRK